MLEYLDSQQISCERCSLREHLKDCLGCGKPPTRSDDSEKAGWDFEKIPGEGVPISPHEAVSKGLPAYRSWGIGNLKLDWEWCPRWFFAFSRATVDGESTVAFVSRAKRYRDSGNLGVLIEPPVTSTLVDLLDVVDYLDEYQRAREREEMEAKIEMDRQTAKLRRQDLGWLPRE